MTDRLLARLLALSYRVALLPLTSHTNHRHPLHQGKTAGTCWAGPPGDVVAAALQLIQDDKEFARLFIQRPEDAAKKKKKDDGGMISLVDGRRAMNCGIGLARLRATTTGVIACLGAMCTREPPGGGGVLLTPAELQALRTLCPTEEEIKLVRSFTGDVSRLGACERFFLAASTVPHARARADGLWYQANFDERVAAARGRLSIMTAAIDQVRAASRFRRFLKVVRMRKARSLHALRLRGLCVAEGLHSC